MAVKGLRTRGIGGEILTALGTALLSRTVSGTPPQALVDLVSGGSSATPSARLPEQEAPAATEPVPERKWRRTRPTIGVRPSPPNGGSHGNEMPLSSGQLSDDSLEIRSRLGLVETPEVFRLVDWLPAKKAGEDLRSGRAVGGLRHPVILLPNAALKLSEAVRRPTQNGQVDIAEQLGIGVARDREMAGGQNQLREAAEGVCRSRARQQGSLC